MDKISPEEFTLIAVEVHRLTGTTLAADKEYLIGQRLFPLLQEFGIRSIAELATILREQRNPHMCELVVDAIVIPETSFFRDQKLFDFLQEELLPQYCNKAHEDAQRFNRQPCPVRIWSAACATGQEPYSLAMTLLAFASTSAKHNSFMSGSRILATDVSQRCLSIATNGVYSEFEVGRGLQESHKKRFFVRQANGWKVIPQVRECVTFMQKNLLTVGPGLGLFDIIFCRNVLIYFAQTERRQIIQSLIERLNQKGILVVGSTEMLTEEDLNTSAGKSMYSETTKNLLFYRKK